MDRLRRFVRWITRGYAGIYKENFLNFFKLRFVRFCQLPFILIYQMGKTGSQTIEYTIRATKPFSLIYRTHYLNYFLENSDKPTALDKQQHRYALNINRTCIYFKKYRQPHQKIQVITSIRDPISRMVAGIFQLHDVVFSSMNEITAEKCQHLIMQKDNVKIARLFHDLYWFEEELKKYFGINVYSQPFPHEVGYQIYENEIARVLVYRFENMQAIQSILENFLQIKIPLIRNINIGSEKNYKDIYRKVKQNIKFPEDYLKIFYDSKMVKYFYTEEEINGFMNRWSTTLLS